MKNIKGLLKLDTRLVTPYWKWLVLFFGLALLFTLIGDRSGPMFMISFTIFSATLTAFPFENTEKSNLNVLYATLPTNRKSMLTARYIFFIGFLVLSLAFAFIVGQIIDVIFDNNIGFEDYALFICLAFGIFVFNVSFQTPFFYGKGYIKGKIFLWIPIIVIMIIMNIPALLDVFGVETNFNIFRIMIENRLTTCIIAVVVGIASFVISFFTSRVIYLKKDF